MKPSKIFLIFMFKPYLACWYKLRDELIHWIKIENRSLWATRNSYRMKPSEIYYSQDSIKEKFDNGHTIYSTLSVCKKHQYVINKIPRMRVCKKDGKWYTLDNRRLLVFRTYQGCQGHTGEQRSAAHREIHHQEWRRECRHSTTLCWIRWRRRWWNFQWYTLRIFREIWFLVCKYKKNTLLLKL